MNKLRAHLPNFITLCNLSLGVMAILLAVSDNGGNNYSKHLFLASLLVMVAAVTDRLDGKVARMLDATSDLGKELDSLSDLISFGLAPVIIAWRVCLFKFHILGYLICLIFPIAGAYRLARYNITKFDNVFCGLPITIAGAFLTIDNLYLTFILDKHLTISLGKGIFSAIFIAFLSYMMVSKIRFKKM